MECFLEITWHVISKLSNAVKSCISDFRVLMLHMLEDSWHHGLDLIDLINILTDLRESHDSCMLIAPVCFVSNGSLHKLTDQRKHMSVTDSSHEPINCSLAKVDIVFLLIFALETFLRSHPACVNIIIDINHKLEDLLKNVLSKSLIFLHEARLTLYHSYDKLKRLMAQ